MSGIQSKFNRFAKGQKYRIHKEEKIHQKRPKIERDLRVSMQEH